MKTEQQMRDNFWITRVESIGAYKKWQANKLDSDLQKLYTEAWTKHQQASTELFMNEVK